MNRAILLSLFVFIQSCASGDKSLPQGRSLIEIRHSHMTIFYDQDRKLARYVIYELKKDNLLKGKYKRRDHFRDDPLLDERNIHQASGKVYKRSGYDRGHLAPAADFSWNKKALEESFYLTNIAPQKPRLNRDSWRRLEEKIRRWACGEERLTVITGPVHEENPKLLKGQIVIPESFFKVVIDETPPRRARAFIYNQGDSGDLLSKREVSLADNRLRQIEEIYPEVTSLERSPAHDENWKEKDCSK
jgi:endonuclease G, mitochondrial